MHTTENRTSAPVKTAGKNNEDSLTKALFELLPLPVQAFLSRNKWKLILLAIIVFAGYVYYQSTETAIVRDEPRQDYAHPTYKLQSRMVQQYTDYRDPKEIRIWIVKNDYITGEEFPIRTQTYTPDPDPKYRGSYGQPRILRDETSRFSWYGVQKGSAEQRSLDQQFLEMKKSYGHQHPWWPLSRSVHHTRP